MTKLRELRNKWMRDPGFRKEYEALEPEFALARTLIEARTNAGLTQEQVAERMGTTQSVVARLESGSSLPSMKSIRRYAEATGTKPEIRLVHS
jgi:predicted transcriptional regulator